MVKELIIEKEIEEEVKEKNLSEKVEEVHEFIEAIKNGTIKKKILKLPRKAKVKKRKLKKGWVGILKIDENGNISGEKVQIHGSAFDLNRETFHATDGRELLHWQGKFPVFLQRTWKKNPLNVRLQDGEKNETYGQKPIMAKMIGDAIKPKKSAGGIIVWILGVVAAYIGYTVLFGGGF